MKQMSSIHVRRHRAGCRRSSNHSQLYVLRRCTPAAPLPARGAAAGSQSRRHGCCGARRCSRAPRPSHHTARAPPGKHGAMSAHLTSTEIVHCPGGRLKLVGGRRPAGTHRGRSENVRSSETLAMPSAALPDGLKAAEASVWASAQRGRAPASASLTCRRCCLSLPAVCSTAFILKTSGPPGCLSHSRASAHRRNLQQGRHDVKHHFDDLRRHAPVGAWKTSCRACSCACRPMLRRPTLRVLASRSHQTLRRIRVRIHHEEEFQRDRAVSCKCAPLQVHRLREPHADSGDPICVQVVPVRCI